MSLAKLLRLDDYRDRRQQRLTLARAFARAAEPRGALFDQLVQVAEVCGADRVGVVWIDEYGPGLVHPHLVVDLLCDRPRRGFPAEPLHLAWEAGIPGSYDSAPSRDVIGPSTLAVALGSDGARCWFLVADSSARRPALESEPWRHLMFLAGECSALVLHQDLDENAARQPADRAAFAGWGYLEDLEDHEGDERRTAIVNRRFVVGRLVSMLLEDDLAVADERRSELAQRARVALGESADEPDEKLAVVLEAYASGDLLALGPSLLALGEDAERQDHVHAAREAYQGAFEVGCALSEPVVAVDAARLSGRVLRRRARWQDADAWYRRALEISQAAGLGGAVARSLAGLGLIKRDLGNLPEARERFESARAAGELSGDREALASVYHDLMILELMAGDPHTALRHGWHAVNTYETDVGRTRCMAGMASVLLELGDLEPAEDAFTLVAQTSEEHYYRIYAYDALGHLAALRGDASQFDIRAAAADSLDWEGGPRSAKAEILLYRGLSNRALERPDEARVWLERAVAFATEHRFSRVGFRAEAELESLNAAELPRASGKGPAPPEVRSGLRAMREELVGVSG